MSWLSNTLTGDDDKRHAEDRRKYDEQVAAQAQAEAARLRAEQKKNQLGLLGQMQGPKVSDAHRRRIAALEAESQPGALVSDANFQGDRAQLVHGAQSSLSGIQNAQAASGASGGFSNQGSINDVYDRLGGQMAQLGQHSKGLKDAKAQSAAEMQQAITEAEIAFANSQTKAKQAIEAGDYEGAQAALQQAYAAKDQIEQRYRAAHDKATEATNGRLGVALGSTIGALKDGGAALMSGGTSEIPEIGNQPATGGTYAAMKKKNRSQETV